MNGVHDMGGMHGMGPIHYESNEPVFHEPWEARLFALNRAVRAWGKWTTDASRHAVELIPAPEYLSMSYYEQRLHALIELMVKSGLLTRTEFENGKPAPGSPKVTPALIASAVPSTVAKGKPASRDVLLEARFTVGQRVRARNIHPTGHTRLPRYARGDRYSYCQGCMQGAGVGLGDLIQFQKPRFELQRLNPRSEKELDRLMDKNNGGKLTEKERARFKTLLDEVQKITFYNSKMLVDQKRRRESKHGKVVAARRWHGGRESWSAERG